MSASPLIAAQKQTLPDFRVGPTVDVREMKDPAN
jgi:hypothetical protein